MFEQKFDPSFQTWVFEISQHWKLLQSSNIHRTHRVLDSNVLCDCQLLDHLKRSFWHHINNFFSFDMFDDFKEHNFDHFVSYRLTIWRKINRLTTEVNRWRLSPEIRQVLQPCKLHGWRWWEEFTWWNWKHNSSFNCKRRHTKSSWVGSSFKSSSDVHAEFGGVFSIGCCCTLKEKW